MESYKYTRFVFILDNNWKQFWCVLRDDTIILYNSQKSSKDTMVGTIAIGPGSHVEKVSGHEQSSFGFRLYTKRSQNNFKAAKAIDRELWKAYVEGIASGNVSSDVDLLPGLIEDVRMKLQEFFTIRRQATLPTLPETADTKIGIGTPDDGYLLPDRRRQSKYRFYTDASRTDIPSWFFFSCSRELSKQILTLGASYGNTLMRESTSSSKHLAISKRIDLSSGYDFSHYVVQQTPQGYKIDVEDQHEPKQTLSEVMEFFIETSGRNVTRPMKCNNLSLLGLESYVYSDYSRKIVATICDADSGEEIADVKDSGSVVASINSGHQSTTTPPLANVNKNATKQENIKDTHHRWSARSTSVPNIQPPSLEQIQAAKVYVPQPPPPPPLPHTSVQHAAQKLKKPITTTAPALPPNHPPPLKKAQSQSGLNISVISKADTKGMTPKHTHSMSSADRKTSPRDKQSTIKAREELAQVTARIIKHAAETEETTPTITESAKTEVPKDLKSPAAKSESFMKALEGIIGSTKVGVNPRPPHDNIAQAPDDCYETIPHYQNVREIPK